MQDPQGPPATKEDAIGADRHPRAAHHQGRAYRLCAGAGIAMVTIPPIVGLRVDYMAFSAFAWLILCFAPVIAYLHWRSFERIRSAVEGLLMVMALTVPILVLSYCAMRLSFPLADARLAGWDASFGWNAASIVAAVGSVPWLAILLSYGYASFSIQILALPPLLAIAGRPSRGYWFVGAFFLTCAIAIAITTFFPALGSFTHFALDGQALGAVNSFFGYHFLDSFNAVRDDPGFVLSPGVASGIVTFPSIHASTAVLCAWAAWPIRWLRAPLVLLNVLMFASAVTHGAHYVVDVVAGAVVALAVIRLWRPPADDDPGPTPAVVSPAGPAGAGAARSA